MYIGLGFLAACAPLYVLFHKFSESRAFVLFANEFPHVRNTQVSSGWGVMEVL